MSIPIICGETAVRHTKEKGIFYCPECEETQCYKKKELWKYYHLYFIPLIPGEIMVTYVKCKKCKSRFEMAVLETQATGVIRCLQTLWQKAMLRVMIRVMMADGRVVEGEITMIRKIYSAVPEKSITKSFIMAEVEKMQAETESDVTTDLEPIKELLGEAAKAKILQAMMLVSAADGEVDPEEKKLVEQVAELLLGNVAADGAEQADIEEAIASKKSQEATAEPHSNVIVHPVEKEDEIVVAPAVSANVGISTSESDDEEMEA